MTLEILLKNRWMPLIVGTLLTLCIAAAGPSGLATLEASVGDWLWQAFAQTEADRQERRVVVVDIDEASITRYGPWPWPRARVAGLLASIREHGAAQRIVDIVFPEAKPGDDRLAEELRTIPTVLAQVLAIDADQALDRGELQGEMSTIGCPVPMPIANAAIGNAPDLRGATAGHITPHIAADGVVRKLPAVICYRQNAYATLALAAMALGMGATPDFEINDGTTWYGPEAWLDHKSLPDLSVPVDAQGDLLLPWWLHRHSIVSVSAHDLMTGNVPAKLLQDAWVLLGATAFSIGDTVSTPQAGTASGLEVHAQLLTGLLDGRVPYQPRGAGMIQFAWMIVVAILLMTAGNLKGGFARAYGPACTGLALLLATIAAHALLLERLAIWQPWALSGCFIAALAALITMQGYFSSRVEGALLYRNLSSYLPAHVAAEIARQEPVGTLEARREQVIVLYADLRNFSAWCDQLPADEAGAVLHNFYTFASKSIDRQGGVVEEYVGDAVMGVWRGQIETLGPLNAAAEIVATAERLFGAETGIDTLPPLAVGVGIERGEVLVGAFGPARRRNHTLLGRAVTTAICLQAMTAELAQPIVLGKNVAERWKDKVAMTSLGNFLLQGRLQPTELFVPDDGFEQTELMVEPSES